MAVVDWISQLANYHTRWWGCIPTIISAGEGYMPIVILVGEAHMPTIIPAVEGGT